MKISVTCPTYGRISPLEEAIESFLKQDFNGEMEMVILNDRSSVKLEFNHPKIKIINEDIRYKTIGDKRNSLISKCEGEIIVPLDDDDILLPGYVSMCVRLLESGKGGHDWVFPQKALGFSREIKDGSPKIANGLIMNTVAFRKSVWERVKFPSLDFDENGEFWRIIKISGFKGILSNRDKTRETYLVGWGLTESNPYHAQIFGKVSPEKVGELIDDTVKISGNFRLNPHWDLDYSKMALDVYGVHVPPVQKSILTNSWVKAQSFMESLKSRGMGMVIGKGEQVSDEILKQRQLSCFGNEQIPACDKLKKVGDDLFCNACGCPNYSLSKLNGEGYTKLHYPHLECPLKKKGFSNYVEDNIINSDTIFVEIISYRDPELSPTVIDLVKNCKHPENLSVGIFRDYDETENIDEIIKLKNSGIKIKMIDRPYKQGLGICEARARGQQLYSGEKYCLNIDSHHRFIKDWDIVLINMYNGLLSKGIKKPLISSYLPSYIPESDSYKNGTDVPWKIVFDKFMGPGNISQHPSFVYEKFTEPQPARFVSGHFIFTQGKWNEEVIHDPYHYMSGEEPMMAVKSYTWGYDLFFPHIVVSWHEYTRKFRVKHWDDDKEWWKKQIAGEKRMRVLFEMEDIGSINFDKYGFGPHRTLSDYCLYSQIDFKNRKANKEWPI